MAKGKGGRPRLVPAVKVRELTITDEQAKLLRRWGKGCMSAGLRWLIDAAAPLICKASDVGSGCIPEGASNNPRDGKEKDGT